ncbi:MAG TPA: isocitrate lyase/phosphoenolpyruvate mutase family protein [Terriglobia bacterium]|nr:isocitrate lyase/phosphoenolpyruvate mutase family protein [Terriglobia bacterium]
MSTPPPTSLALKAERFRELHQGPRILVLANVWDVASARIVEHAGFPALATSSAAVANSLGYPDGQRISRAEMLEVVRRIAAKASVPVSADLEAGYGETHEAIAETAAALIDAGAVGLNLEDRVDKARLVPVEQHAAKVSRIREVGASLGVRVVINARTDVYLAQIGEPASRFEHTVRRLRAYREAGADSLFVPGVYDAETIGRLVQAAPGPLNVLANPAAPPLAELERLGVRRVSFGSWPARAALGLFSRFAHELMEKGTFTSLGDGALSSAESNRLVS